MNTRKIQLLTLTLLSLLAAFFFSDGSLDHMAAGAFFTPESGDLWVHQHDPLWKFFYFAAPALTGVLLLGSLLVAFLSMRTEKWARYRIYAVYVFIVVLLGPGIAINSVLKPFWGRPRPRQVVEYQGNKDYRPFYVAAVGEEGKSFPCGHCSVGYSFGVFGFILQSQPVLALGFLLGSAALGLLMGVGRIAAGGHFFSDVVWSGLIVYWIAFTVYHFVLKVPEREKKKAKNVVLTRKVKLIYAALGVLTVLVLLLASPFNKKVHFVLDAPKAQTIEITVDRASLQIIPSDKNFEIQGSAKGFGFPKSDVQVFCEGEVQVICVVKRSGIFTDFESQYKFFLNLEKFESVKIKIAKTDVTKNELSADGRLQISPSQD